MTVSASNDVVRYHNAALDELSKPTDEISHSPYDIAILALSPYAQQESCIQWLLDHRLKDGTWGTPSKISWYDRYICTYATALSLRNAGFNDHAEQALAALRQITPDQYIKAPETLTFGGLLETLDRYAQAREWIAFQHQPRICAIIDDERIKWQKMQTWNHFYDPTYSIAGYCGERVYADPQIDLEQFIQNFQAANGSISTSAAASSMTLLELERRGNGLSKPVERLRSYIASRNPYQHPIGYLDHIPFFVTAWSLMLISELKLPFNNTRYPVVQTRIERMLDTLTDGEQRCILSTTAAPTTIPGDPDSTSCALLASAYGGKQIADISGLNALYRADEGYYQTFQYERDPSLTTNIHMAAVLAMRDAPQLDPVLRWLQHEIAQSGNTTCKWHVSPYYTMGEMARILAPVRHPVAQALALYAAEYLLATQKTLGSWGIDSPTIEETGYAVLGLASVFDNLQADENRHHRSFLQAIHNSLLAANSILQESCSYPNLWIGKSLYCVKPLVPILQNVAAGRICQVVEKHKEFGTNSASRRYRPATDRPLGAHQELERVFQHYPLLQKACEVVQRTRSEEYLSRTERFFSSWAQPLAIEWSAELVILNMLILGTDAVFENCPTERELERVADALSAIGRFNNAMLYLLSLPETETMNVEDAAKIHLAFTTAAGYRRLQVFCGHELADRWFKVWWRLISVHNQQQVEQCAAVLSPDRYRPALFLELSDAVQVYLDLFQHTGGLSVAVLGAFPFSEFASDELLSGLVELTNEMEALFRVVQDVNIDLNEVLNLGTFVLAHERGVTISEAWQSLRKDNRLLSELEGRLRVEEISYFARADHAISRIADKYKDEKVRRTLADFSKVLIAIARKLSTPPARV